MDITISNDLSRDRETVSRSLTEFKKKIDAHRKYSAQFYQKLSLLEDFVDCEAIITKLCIFRIPEKLLLQIIGCKNYYKLLSLLNKLESYEINTYTSLCLVIDDYKKIDLIIDYIKANMIFLPCEIIAPTNPKCLLIIDSLYFAITQNFSNEMFNVMMQLYTRTEQFSCLLFEIILSNSSLREQAFLALDYVKMDANLRSDPLLFWLFGVQNQSIVAIHKKMWREYSDPFVVLTDVLRTHFSQQIKRTVGKRFFVPLITLLERWTSQALLSPVLYSLFIDSFVNPAKFSAHILSLIIHVKEPKQQLGWELYHFFKSETRFVNNTIFKWIRSHKNHTALAMQVDLLIHYEPIYRIASSNADFFDQKNTQRTEFILQIFNIMFLRKLTRFLTEVFKVIPPSNLIQELENYISKFVPLHQLDNGTYYLTKNQFFSSNLSLILFENRYETLLNNTSKVNCISFDKLFMKKIKPFSFLFFFFPQQHEAILSKLLDTSVIKIKKFLEIIESLIETDDYLLYYIYSFLDNLRFTTAKNIINLFQYLSLITTGKKISNYSYLINLLLQHINTSSGTDDFILKRLFTLLNAEFLQQLSPAIKFQSVYSPEQFSQLYRAYCIHHQNDYSPVYLRLLKCYIQNQPITNFLHDVAQDDIFGREIALNNQFTYNLLKRVGINTKPLKSYPSTGEFLVYGEKRYLLNLQIVGCWQLINKFLECSSQLTIQGSGTLLAIKELQKFHFQIKNRLKNSELTLDNWLVLNFFINATNLNNLTKTLRRFRFINSNNIELKQCADALVDKFNQLQACLRPEHDNEALHWKKPRLFSTSVWRKNDPMTLFLGDQLGCCMSSQGEQFVELVMRIVDVNLQFIIVMDDELKEAVAGLWLYIAKDIETQENFLVANFAEMRNAVARDHILRDAIMLEMLQFTERYAKALNLTFILGSLNHGELPEWKFEQCYFQLTKLGKDRLQNFETYYLSSLEEKLPMYRYNCEAAYRLYGESSEFIHHKVYSPLVKSGLFKALNHKHDSLLENTGYRNSTI